MIDSTGPKISSRAMRMSLLTLAKMVGLHIVALVQPRRPAGAAGDQRRLLVDAGLDQALDLVPLHPRRHRAHLGAAVRIADGDLRDRVAGDDDRPRPSARAGTIIRVSALQVWPELPTMRRRRRASPRPAAPVVEDDVGALAAQLLRHALDRRRRVPGDLDAGAGRAGERDHVHLRVAGQRHADADAVAVDEVEHARRARRPRP